MSHNAARLTSFAILSALEEDLRQQILTYLPLDHDVHSIGQVHVSKANERRRKAGLAAAGSPRGVVEYLDLGEEYAILKILAEPTHRGLQDSLQCMGGRLGKLVSIRNRVAHSRPMELEDPAFLIDMANDLLALDSAIWQAGSETLRHLQSDPAFVLGLTMNLPKDPEGGPVHNLPVPDFDETGFFGRRDDVRRIRKALNGAYPVVSITGDGGIGKTSLALKVAYELLEDPSTDFEAIVWASAKSTMLNVSEITKIQGAIENSLGLLGAAAGELTGVDVSDPRTDVLTYLENFRVLLILDNLETVLDQGLRDFLQELPVGSKVLITSRIGVGAVEWPWKLGPLQEEEARNYIRALGRSKGLAAIASAKDDAVKRWAEAMGGHPAYMRWFVSGIQAGRRPEELLRNNELLLTFCMSNVYSYLSVEAQELLTILLVVQGSRSQSELAFLAQIDAEALQARLFELLNTNFVAMSSVGSDSSPDTLYSLTDFARQYLERTHGPKPNEAMRIRVRREELNALAKGMSFGRVGNAVDPRVLRVRTPGDYPLVKMLREALSHADAGEFIKARALCSECQQLAPSYSEGWRTQGMILHAEGSFHEAASSFEQALELDPKSASTCLHIGSWYVDSGYDIGRGLEVLQAAVRSDGSSKEALVGIAWAHFSLGSFSDAFAAVEGLLDLDITTRETRAATQLALMSVIADAHVLLISENYDEAATAVERGLEACERYEDGFDEEFLLDSQIVLAVVAEEVRTKAIGYAATSAKRYLRSLDEAVGNQNRIGGVFLPTTTKEHGYIFAKTADGDVFCHAREFLSEDDWEAASAGDYCVLSVERPDGHRMRGARVRRFV